MVAIAADTVADRAAQPSRNAPARLARPGSGPGVDHKKASGFPSGTIPQPPPDVADVLLHVVDPKFLVNERHEVRHLHRLCGACLQRGLPARQVARPPSLHRRHGSTADITVPATTLSNFWTAPEGQRIRTSRDITPADAGVWRRVGSIRNSPDERTRRRFGYNSMWCGSASRGNHESTDARLRFRCFSGFRAGHATGIAGGRRAASNVAGLSRSSVGAIGVAAGFARGRASKAEIAVRRSSPATPRRAVSSRRFGGPASSRCLPARSFRTPKSPLWSEWITAGAAWPETVTSTKAPAQTGGLSETGASAGPRYQRRVGPNAGGRVHSPEADR